jgi:putative zinc finger/helix-turn-helix YgiT family protein
METSGEFNRKEGSDKEAKLQCPNCGGTNIETIEKEHTFTYGTDGDVEQITAKVPAKKCLDCGFRYLDAAAHEKCHEALCDHLGVMSPSKIKGLRMYLGLTQSEFAKITGLGEATLSRWERGLVIQNKAYDNYLYLLGLEGNLRKIAEHRRKTSLGEAQTTLDSNRPTFRKVHRTNDLLDKQNKFQLNGASRVRCY